MIAIEAGQQRRDSARRRAGRRQASPYLPIIWRAMISCWIWLAFVEAEQPDVAVEALDAIVGDVAARVDLHGAVGDPATISEA